MTIYRVKLTPEMPELARFLGRDYYRVRITASDAENMPNEIFVFQKTLVNAATEETQDEFVCVAGPFDITSYPVGSPADDQTPPYFRLAEFDVLLPSSSLAVEFIADVQAQVNALINALRSLDRLLEGAAIWCPSAPTTTTTTAAP